MDNCRRTGPYIGRTITDHENIPASYWVLSLTGPSSAKRLNATYIDLKFTFGRVTFSKLLALLPQSE